tara:strand:- start:52 stop:258 length:207 start_codon:yes stop_codon:yes gene_type:complete
MPVSNSTAAWAAIREDQAAKEQTEMLKVVGFVAVILGVAFFVNRINRRRSILRAKQANLTSRVLSMNI